MDSSVADSAEETWQCFRNPNLLYLKLVYFTYVSCSEVLGSVTVSVSKQPESPPNTRFIPQYMLESPFRGGVFIRDSFYYHEEADWTTGMGQLGAWAVARPYLALFLAELGLSEFQVGVVRCLEPGAIIVLSPVWGSIADKYQNRKSLMVICAFGSAVFLPALLFVPPVDQLVHIRNVTISLNNESGVTEVVRMVSHSQRDIFPAISLFTFILTALISLTEDVFMAGFTPLLDAQTMALLQRYPEASYGGQRWPGALAVVVFSPVVGLLTDWYGGTVTREEAYFLRSSYVPCFILFAFLVLISTIPTLKTESVRSRPLNSFSRELLAIFRQFHVVLTFVVFVVAGACKGAVGTFLFIFLDELGASKFLMSISLVAMCIIEVPCLLISGRIIAKLGYETVIFIGLLAYVVRMYAYSILVNPWYILPIELLHGVCFGILWPACTEFANSIAPEGMSSTLQSLKNSAKSGIGEMIGMSVGGLIYNLYGARALYRQFTAVTVAVMIFYALESIYVRHRDRKEKQVGDIKEENTEKDPLFGEEQYE